MYIKPFINFDSGIPEPNLPWLPRILPYKGATWKGGGIIFSVNKWIMELEVSLEDRGD